MALLSAIIFLRPLSQDKIRFGAAVEAEAMFVRNPVGLSLLGSLVIAKEILLASITVNLNIGKLVFAQ